MIAVTGATGQLGRLVVAALLNKRLAAPLVAVVRDPAKAGDLAGKGVLTRQADYEQPKGLQEAFAGVEKLLLISGSELGRRAVQHAAVIDAARRAGVALIAYTSVLHADRSTLGLAEEHRQTEADLRQSGVPHVLLRNGWYSENYTAAIPQALAHGAVFGSAGQGRIASASRSDFADAAAAILASVEDQAGRIYELAGDDAYTLEEFAAELSRQAGVPIRYQDIPEADYRNALIGAGLPQALAAMIAQSDAAARDGALFDAGRQLSKLIGRPTTPLKAAIAAALKA
ncbi:MAG: SDR family oxidoreductase [Rhodospirillaceae bacterium]|nr:SDR family oxidoreductase [Rhodospirillaceae bacterium]